MLKWTVNGPRQSYLQAADNFESTEQSPLSNLITNRAEPHSNTAAAERRKLKRKSSDSCAFERKLHSTGIDKENHMTSSTPLHSSTRCASSNDSPLRKLDSPLRKLDSLKDLSNIVPEHSHATPKLRPSPKPQNPLKTPEGQARERAACMPMHYASTLPTFDVEYSPCGLIPGQMLALRGVGIADRYFEKPRYLTQDFNDIFTQRAPEPRTSTNRQTEKPPKSAFPEEDSSLSSSKMGDMTLERMIDAILESTRKERKLPKNAKPNACPASSKNMSPTYTAADDPASDLHEFWDTQSEKYCQDDTERTFCESTFKQIPPFNEREVRATVVKRFKKENLFQLRRQRAVRRKRKISTKISSSVKSSAQKLLSLSGATGQQTSANSQPNLRASNTIENASKNESTREEAQVQTSKSANNISPDSGHNSSSDLDDSTLEQSNCEYCEGNAHKSACKGLDATKRRLSFSANNIKNLST